MKLRATSGLLEGWEGEASITTETSASSYGIPVRLIDDEPVGAFDAIVAQYEILEANDEERKMLKQAGYRLPDAS
jgi:hypothetical protein